MLGPIWQEVSSRGRRRVILLSGGELSGLLDGVQKLILENTLNTIIGEIGIYLETFLRII